MIKKLVKHGNSAALIIDKPILDLLKVELNTPFEVTTDGKNIFISPQLDINAENDLIDSLNKINKRHSKTLKRLAE